jgi:hypothetical protein
MQKKLDNTIKKFQINPLSYRPTATQKLLWVTLPLHVKFQVLCDSKCFCQNYYSNEYICETDNSIKFFIYWCAELDSYRPITESAWKQNNNNNTQEKKQTNTK